MVLNVGLTRSEHHGVGEQVTGRWRPLIKPRTPPASVVFTVWLSMT